MSGVEENGDLSDPSNATKRPHIDNQVSIPVRCPTLGNGDRRGPRGTHLLHGAGGFFRCHPLSLLDVHCPSRTSCRDEKVGLPAEKCGNLDDVHDASDRFGLEGLVDVREEGQASLFPHPSQALEPDLKAHAAGRINLRPIRFVEGRLEDDG